MADVQARLLTYRSKYTFDGVEYAPLMYKIIMRLVTIHSVTTTQTLHNRSHVAKWLSEALSS